MKKGWIWIAVVVALMLIVTGCGGGNDNAAQTATGETKEFTIKGTNFAFDLQEIVVNQGDTVKITFKNEEGMHAVKFNGYNVEVQDGKTVSFVANKKGEFDYVCSIFCGTGHDDMTGKLIVQ